MNKPKKGVSPKPRSLPQERQQTTNKNNKNKTESPFPKGVLRSPASRSWAPRTLGKNTWRRCGAAAVRAIPSKPIREPSCLTSGKCPVKDVQKGSLQNNCPLGPKGKSTYRKRGKKHEVTRCAAQDAC